MVSNRYEGDVLDPKNPRNQRRQARECLMQLGMIVEDPLSGFVGEIMRWENGIVVCEDRHGKLKSFPIGPGFLYEGQPVILVEPVVSRRNDVRYSRSGSRKGPSQPARTALPSRIYVEGRHDAELVEKIWGDDLRHVGVVVEYLGGIDDLVSVVANFQPSKGRRLGVLVDHLIDGTKEDHIVTRAVRGYRDYVMVVGHRFIDIWQAIRPEVLGMKTWPKVSKAVDFKKGTLQALGMPCKDQADIARAWKYFLSRVNSWRDLDTDLVRQMERLIDFVTLDHLDGDC